MGSPAAGRTIIEYSNTRILEYSSVKGRLPLDSIYALLRAHSRRKTVMRRRSAFARAGLALCSAWTVVALLDSPQLHTCPMHNGAAGHMAHATYMTRAEHEHAMPGMTPPHSGSAPPHSPYCTCLGDCAAPLLAVVARTAPPVTNDIALVDPSAPSHATPGVAPVECGVVLPFANGPPVVG